MKTDTILRIELSKANIEVKHKTLMGDVGLFFQAANVYRVLEGAPAIPQSSWFATRGAKEYIQFLRDSGIPEPVKLSRGRGRSYAHLKVLLRASIDMSPQMADEVIDMFITRRLPALRDEGGDNFLAMNTALELAADSVLGKPAHKGHFINLARILKKRCDLEGPWETATPEQHAHRAVLEDRLATLLRAGVVRDWDHLKELAEKV